MEDSETVVCRLCLNITTDDEYQLLDNISKDMIKFIVPEVDLEISRDPKICQTCYKTVLRCYRFKTNCKKEVKTDMKRDLGKGETAISVHIEELEKKCNFCSNNIDNDSVEDVSARKTYFTDVLQRCLPEWNLNSDTIPCKSCIDTLTNQYMFIGNCVDTEDKLRQYRLTSGTNNEEKLNLYEAVQQLLSRQCKDSSSMTEIDEFPKTGGENLPFPEVDANAEREIKMETIDIKSEISEMPEESPSTSKSVIPNISESKEGNGSLKRPSSPSTSRSNIPKKRIKKEVSCEAKLADSSANKRSVGVQVNLRDFIQTRSIGIQVNIIPSLPIAVGSSKEGAVVSSTVSSTSGRGKKAKKFKPRILQRGSKKSQK